MAKNAQEAADLVSDSESKESAPSGEMRMAVDAGIAEADHQRDAPAASQEEITPRADAEESIIASGSGPAFEAGATGGASAGLTSALLRRAENFVSSRVESKAFSDQAVAMKGWPGKSKAEKSRKKLTRSRADAARFGIKRIKLLLQRRKTKGANARVDSANAVGGRNFLQIIPAARRGRLLGRFSSCQRASGSSQA